MPFKEHRGGGRGGRVAEDMAGVWDANWRTAAPDWRACERDHKWPHVRMLLPAGGKVLEAGCGLGQWVRFLNEQGFDAWGVDFAGETIERGRELWPEIGQRLQRGDLRSLPFADATFDGMVSFGAVEHNEEGIEAPLADMLRVLKPGGVLYCSVPALNHVRAAGALAVKDWVVRNPWIRKASGRSPEVSFYQYVFSPDEYRRRLTSVGFEVLELLPQTYMDRFLGSGRSVRRRLVETVHGVSPWTTAHMMGAWCRKPLA